MVLTVEQWHQRYQEQARWTAPLRDYIFKQINLSSAGAVLEVGCGTGAVLSTLPPICKKFGLDIDVKTLTYAASSDPTSPFTCADAFSLPYVDASFDIVFCHYLLLWTISPHKVVAEMKRVTRSGGYVVALAEPDHASRVDHPSTLAPLGELQSRSLQRQGVNLEMGRQLSEVFSASGLHEVKFGVSGFQREISGLPNWFDSEWQILEHDLADDLPSEELARYHALDRQAWMDGSRVLWVPTFYAYGRV
jgi:SAM-dependent methyltransferase